MYVWPHIISVVSPTAGGEDELGNPIVTDGTPMPWRGFFGSSSSTADIGTPDEPGRFATTVVVILEPAAIVAGGDDIVFGSRRYRIVGEPILQTDLQGTFRHIELTVIGYAAEELIGS